MSDVSQVHAAVTSVVEFKERLFIICDDCFWCASTINTRIHHVDSCPQCQKAISSLPISTNEAYRYNYSANRGVELEFYTL